MLAIGIWIPTTDAHGLERIHNQKGGLVLRCSQQIPHPSGYVTLTIAVDCFANHGYVWDLLRPVKVLRDLGKYDEVEDADS